MTGHDNGLITIALTEADDIERERRRLEMGEPYRTLLGHFRHEVGHYFWDVLVRDGGKLDACRAVFGDDFVDYGQALAAPLCRRRPAGLAAELRLGLCDHASLGGFRRDLGALSAHRRHPGDGRRVRHGGAAARPTATGS